MTVSIVMTAAVCAVTPSSGLCCCFFTALQRRSLPLAHNFRLVSQATRVSAHGEQPSFPAESFCQYSHDHQEREGAGERCNSYPFITYISVGQKMPFVLPSSQIFKMYLSPVSYFLAVTHIHSKKYINMIFGLLSNATLEVNLQKTKKKYISHYLFWSFYCEIPWCVLMSKVTDISRVKKGNLERNHFVFRRYNKTISGHSYGLFWALSNIGIYQKHSNLELEKLVFIDIFN